MTWIEVFYNTYSAVLLVGLLINFSVWFVVSSSEGESHDVWKWAGVCLIWPLLLVIKLIAGSWSALKMVIRNG
jgi:hypothetical protein